MEPGQSRQRPTTVKSLGRLLLPALSGFLAVSACGESGTPSTVTAQTVFEDASVAPAPHDCEADTGSATDVATEPPWRGHAPYREWTDKVGCRIRIDVLAERPGPQHCEWDSASVLITGNEIGARYTSASDMIEYVRDPDGAFGRAELTGGLDRNASVPDEATDTGFRRGPTQLWTVPGEKSAVWMVEHDGAERWPAGTTPACA